MTDIRPEPDESFLSFADAQLNQPNVIPDAETVDFIVGTPTPVDEAADGLTSHNPIFAEIEDEAAMNALRGQVVTFAHNQPAALAALLLFHPDNPQHSPDWWPEARVATNIVRSSAFISLPSRIQNPGDLLTALAQVEQTSMSEQAKAQRRAVLEPLCKDGENVSRVHRSELEALDDDARTAAYERMMELIYGRRWEAYQLATGYTDMQSRLVELGGQASQSDSGS